MSHPAAANDDDEDPGDKRWFPLMLVFTVLVATAVFGSRPMISYLALGLGAGPAELGFIASSFAALSLLAAIPLGRLIDRFGEWPIMVAGGLACVVACAALPLMGSIPALALGQAALGLGQLMAVVGAHTMLANRGPARKRAFRIGLYTSAASLGHALGPGAAGLIAGDDVSGGSGTLVLFGAAGVSLLATLLAVVIPRVQAGGGHREDGAAPRATVLDTLRLPGMMPALASGIVSLTAVDLLVAYLPAYGEERSITPQVIGFSLAILAFAQMSSRIALGRLLDLFGHVRVLVGSIVLAGVFVPALVVPLAEPGLYAIMIVVGLGLGLTQPLTIVWVAHATPPASRGLAMGVRMGGNRVGQLLVPVLVGSTAGQLGVSAIFIATAAMLGASAGYVVRERRMLLTEEPAAARAPATSQPGGSEP
jgi:MFS family permease